MIAEKIVYAFMHPKETEAIGIEGHRLTMKEFNCEYQTKRILGDL